MRYFLPSCWLLLAACATGATPSPGDRLHGRRPLQAYGVTEPGRLTDGVVAVDGDPWNTDLTSVLADGARIIWDLGRDAPIDAVYLHGDNNDRFILAVSDDGKRYRALWEAPPVRGAGMRPRHAAGLGAHGRFVRLTARGGDRHVSVDELSIYERRPEVWPPRMRRLEGELPETPLKRALVLVVAALALCGLLADKRLPALVRWGALALPAAALWWLWPRLVPLWPVSGEVLAFLRASLALAVAPVLWRLSFARANTQRSLALAVLAMLAVAALACFYNLGRPWFYDHAKGRPTMVHTFDMRVYYPVAKYFDELRFDGLYLASTAAYLDGTSRDESSLRGVRMRNLRNNQMVAAADVVEDIRGVRARFTPERWRAFVEDMRYFWLTMGRGDYLGSMRDHGGNATPAWLAIAHLMFRGSRANEATLTLTGLLDPALLLVLLVCVARTFGMVTMLACLLIFGVTDFPMLGSNWAGSTLRFDWMVAVGLGACALRVGRPALGGALLGYGAMMRAFPALALIFAAAPAAWTLVEALHRGDTVKSWLRRQSALWRMAGAAFAVAVSLVVLSSVLFGFVDSWGAWRDKITMHAEKANTNHVGLRTVLAWSDEYAARRVIKRGEAEPWTQWQKGQLETLERRRPLWWAAAVILCSMAFAACRRTRPEHAALVGMLLLPVLFYPANYYCHYIFLLPMLATLDEPAGRRWLWPATMACLLTLCVAQYFTRHAGFSDERFYYQSLWLLAMIVALLLLRVRVQWKGT